MRQSKKGHSDKRWPEWKPKVVKIGYEASSSFSNEASQIHLRFQLGNRIFARVMNLSKLASTSFRSWEAYFTSSTRVSQRHSLSGLISVRSTSLVPGSHRYAPV